MALEGTLRDFSLADIFQLIGLQKKTGILTLRNPKEEARILFMNGLVVGADTNSQKLENHLGHVLVKSNRITQEELEEVLVVQSHTLQRLGQVLIQKGFIKQEDLRESLQIQTTQIIYRLFRWSDGEYHFQQEKFVDYDQENFSPITSESILMEGVRMLDEWPMIEAIIPNFDVLLEKTEKGATLKLDVDKDFSLQGSVGESFDDLLEDVLSDEPPEKKEKNVDLSPKMEMILKMVDGVSIVQDIIDQSGMNDFETCRVLYDLMNMGYVRRAVRQEAESGVKVIEEEHRIPVWIPACLVGVIALFSFIISWNPLNQFFPFPTQLEKADHQFVSTTAYRLDRTAQAIDLYFIREGRLPPTLGLISREGLVPEYCLRDPKGRSFQYEPLLEENQYTLLGTGPQGEISEGLKRAKTFPAPILKDQE